MVEHSADDMRTKADAVRWGHIMDEIWRNACYGWNSAEVKKPSKEHQDRLRSLGYSLCAASDEGNAKPGWLVIKW